MQNLGHWKWITSGISIPASNQWYPGQPDNSNGVERCLELIPKLNDARCGVRTYFICERQ